MENITIKRADKKDLHIIQNFNKNLLDLESRYYNEYITNTDYAFTQTGKRYFLNMITNNFVIIAYINELPIGYLSGFIENIEPCFSIRFGVIDNMYVSYNYRKNGVGSYLVKEFKNYCLSNNVNYLKVSAWARNINAINFYNKHGISSNKVTLVGKI